MIFKMPFQYTKSAADVYAAHTTADVIRTRSEALGARNIEVQVSTNADKTVVTLVRELPAQTPPSLPRSLKKFLKPWNKMSQIETWTQQSNGVYNCDMQLKPEGVPVTIRGKMILTPTAEGCHLENITEVKSAIPFVGKTLEKLIIEASKVGLLQELNHIENTPLS